MSFSPSLRSHLTRVLCVLCLGFSGTFYSCTSPKKIIYFQGNDLRYSDNLKYSIDTIRQSYTPTVQPNDLLSIVIGSLSPEADIVFNVPNQYTTSAMSYGAAGGNRQQSLGYLVDSEGNIEMPLLGKIHIQDLKTQEAADTLRRQLTKFLREPTVTIRSLNFKVSVLGEVNRPAVYVIPDEKITLPELLGLAGDLTIYGRRDNITVIREENGLRQYAQVDLTSRNIFDSPYYYLHKNDLVYIEPVKARMAFADRGTQLMPLAISIVSALGFIIVTLIR